MATIPSWIKFASEVASSLSESSPSPAAAAVLTSIASSFGVMLIGCYAARSGWLGVDQRKGIAMLYSQLVFPTMVFKGVAAIDVAAIDWSVALVVLASKAALALIVLTYGLLTLRASHGRGAALSNAAAFAMAASHSFDVTLGVPLAKELYKAQVPYVYLNQSIQLVAVNPILLMLMDFGDAAAKGSSASTLTVVRKALLSTAKNPLVVLTAAGILASQLSPGGLPPVTNALATQVSAAGPCLGFLCLGFALGALGGTTAIEGVHATVLCGAKIVLMPMLYVFFARRLGSGEAAASAAPLDFLAFLGALPASASVYSLTLTRNLSPRVVGPLVPASMLLSVALSLSPLFPAFASVGPLVHLGVTTVSLLALHPRLRKAAVAEDPKPKPRPKKE